jgi:hypothetical protein
LQPADLCLAGGNLLRQRCILLLNLLILRLKFVVFALGYASRQGDDRQQRSSDDAVVDRLDPGYGSPVAGRKVPSESVPPMTSYNFYLEGSMHFWHFPDRYIIVRVRPRYVTLAGM